MTNKNDYLLDLPETFEEFKTFLLKILPKGDFIVKEIKTFPYKIITSSSHKNLFKYKIVPREKKKCSLLIKDLFNKRQPELVNIKNLMEYPIV